MIFKECLEKRFSCRDFIDYELSEDELIKIVELAKLSPSATNMQPAKLSFFSGNALAKLSDDLFFALNNGLKSQDVKLYPNTWCKPYKSRRFETGLRLYEALGIKRDDKQKRLEQWHKNYKFFNAKNLAILHIDKGLNEGSLLDAGIFLANFLNAATSLGYDTCVLGSVAEYCDTIRANGVDGLIICAIAIGKKSDDVVNNFRTTRAKNEEIIKFIKEIK